MNDESNSDVTSGPRDRGQPFRHVPKSDQRRSQEEPSEYQEETRPQ